MTKISQREARRLKRRVKELESILERQRLRWAAEWPGGVNFATTVNMPVDTMAAIRTARALGHAVVVVPGSEVGNLRFYGVKLPEVMR